MSESFGTEFESPRETRGAQTKYSRCSDDEPSEANRIVLKNTRPNQWSRAKEIETRVGEVSEEYGPEFAAIYRRALNAIPLEQRLEPYKVLRDIRGPYLKQFQKDILQQGNIRCRCRSKLDRIH